MTDTQTLAEHCLATAKVAHDAAGWSDKYAANLSGIGPTLKRRLQKSELMARRLARAATRPMCTGVFGPSQAGKSYLISALARKEGTPLMIRLGDQTKDFVKKINPEGGTESTGLVTRFTINRSEAPASHPVMVRLLTQVDLIKIMTNTYFLDFDPKIEEVPEPAAIDAAFAEVEGRARSSPVDPLNDLEIDDLRSYMENLFKSRRTWDVLVRSGYWDRLEALAPRLAITDRLQLLKFLWGGLQPFSDIYLLLYTALEELDFAENAYCGIEALEDRDESIIDVQLLWQIGDDTVSKVAVRGDNGREAQISKSTLTAIVAELVMEMTEAPYDYFNHTDLLDFPGARSRNSFKSYDETLGDREKLGKTLLRGKVAYLFERYSAEFELTSLILCIIPGNQEVRTLPDYINPWIEATHGKTPAERANVDTAFFLCLTKFDLMFEDAKGKSDDSANRWSNAIHNGLVDLFGANSDWVETWQPGEAFNNTYWIRNPNFYARGLMKYDDDEEGYQKTEDASPVEIGLANKPRVDRMKTEYLNNDLIKRHVGDPGAAWDAAFALNDGGIGYLAGKLGPVCRPELKLAQVLQRLEALRADMLTGLKPHYVSEDGEEQRQQRVAEAKTAAKHVLSLATSQRMGHFLNSMTVAPETLVSVFTRTAAMMDEEDAPDMATSGSAPTNQDLSDLLDDDLLVDLGLGGDEAETGPAAETAFTRLVDVAIAHWVEEMTKSSEDRRLRSFLNVESETLAILLRELTEGIRTTGTSEQIAAAVEKVSQTVERGRYAHYKPAWIAAEMINEFVMTLGQTALPEAERAQRKGQPVFQRLPRIDKLDRLPEQPASKLAELTTDWVVSLLDLTERNARHGAGLAADPEQNRSLGTMLRTLQQGG